MVCLLLKAQYTADAHASGLVRDSAGCNWPELQGIRCKGDLEHLLALCDVQLPEGCRMGANEYDLAMTESRAATLA